MVNVQTRPFYLVSLGKLALLFFVTLGWYSIVWFYLHWDAQNKTQKKQVLPILRAILCVFFMADLCRRLASEQQKQAVAYDWSPARLVTVLVVVFAINLLLTVGYYMQLISPDVQLFSLVLNLPIFYIMYQFQLVANRVMGDPFGQENKSITPVNTLWIGFGLFMWLNLFFALFSDAPTS
jgi:hypothetical protein